MCIFLIYIFTTHAMILTSFPEFFENLECLFHNRFKSLITLIKWFGFRMKYIVGIMTGKQQKPMYQYSCNWTKLIQPYLDPTARPVIKRKYVTRKEIPGKLIRFSLYFPMLNAWTWNGCAIVPWKNCSVFIPCVNSMTFISMDCSEVFLGGAGVILGLGILQIAFILLYFFTRTINKLVNIKARQMVRRIQSFLEIETI